MVHEIDITDYLKKHIPLIDVRSPGEFRKGHIPGAVNVPLFTDIERAHLGTVYTKLSAEKAVELAYGYIKPKRSDIIAESEKVIRWFRRTFSCEPSPSMLVPRKQFPGSYMELCC